MVWIGIVMVVAVAALLFFPWTEDQLSDLVQLYAIRPEKVEPETTEPETTEPETTEPETTELEKVDSETIGPEKVDPETIESEEAEPGNVEPETIGPEKVLEKENHESFSETPESEQATKGRWVSVLKRGRAGNLMFMIASGMGIAKEVGAKFCMQKVPAVWEFFEGESFRPEKCPDVIENEVKWKESGFGRFDTSIYDIARKDNVSIVGYLQSFKYFDQVSVKSLRIRPDLLSQTSQALKKFNIMLGDYVAIHIRREDKVSQRWFRFGTEEYFDRAVKLFPNENFLVVCQLKGIRFCRDHRILSRFPIVSNSVVIDFVTLARAKAVISTVGSTFAWWGAYIGNSPLVYFQQEMNLDVFGTELNKKDYYPPNSVPISTGEVPEFTAVKIFPSVIVSAYFAMKSKHSLAQYELWMENLLSLDDALIIFTDTQSEAKIWAHRPKEFWNKTMVYTTYPVTGGRLAKYNSTFWEKQNEIDPERKIHTPSLYVVWNAKVSFVEIATRLNPFRSKWFLWSDVGCYRSRDYFGASQTRNLPALLEKTAAIGIFVNIHPFAPAEMSSMDQSTIFFDRCNGSVSCRRIAAAQWACSFHYCRLLADAYYQVLDEYVASSKFAGNDQNVLATMCLKYSQLCYLLNPSQTYNSWFGLQPVLAGEYDPPIKSLKQLLSENWTNH